MTLKEAKRSENKTEQIKESPIGKKVLRKYGAINNSGAKNKPRTINELYKERYKIKNH
ncbi:hypothetical protein QNH47_00075 [Virgibacillus halodenitrificans]|uniref:hypothetical protein n=1 Tax=Virgibacillus halodenitrificans TaxID=1482 RepID=UPI0024BFB962|nr:hypothetical protein [Virgibacillus halodenitrificans]WHX26284.1 hypothetical protein QNH47_00075 [Virgibacillus halodenitrificans]